MDTTTSYRKIVKQTLLQYAQWCQAHGAIRLDVVLDDTHSRYAFMQVGWDRGRRVRGNLVYMTLDRTPLANSQGKRIASGLAHGQSNPVAIGGLTVRFPTRRPARPALNTAYPLAPPAVYPWGLRYR